VGLLAGEEGFAIHIINGLMGYTESRPKIKASLVRSLAM
jgi:hypothetical protein